MLELTELQFQYIGRFVDKQTIILSGLGNFIQVDGENVNTGGSSGSGKSTIFQALDFLLGFNNKPMTILQSRKSINPEEKPLWVQGKFNLAGDTITIFRSEGTINITVGGETYKKSKAEEKIDELLGMPRELFRKVIHKRQREGGFFLSLRPTEMHNFLMDCIGLTPFKAHFAKVDARLKDLEKYIQSEEQTIERTNGSLSATQDAILALGLAPVQDMHKEVILELEEKSNKSAARLLEVRTRCEAMVQEYVRNRPDTTIPGHDGTVREDLERRRKEIESKISASLEGERQRQEGVRRSIHQKSLERSATVSRLDRGDRAKADAAKIAAEIKSIRASTCPTCYQEWKTESALTVEKAKLAELSSLKTMIDDAANAALQKKTLDTELENLNALLAPVHDPLLPDLNEDLANITEQILQEKKKAEEVYAQRYYEMQVKSHAFTVGREDLQKKCDLELEQARGQADLDRRVLDVAVQKLHSYEVAKANYNSSLEKLRRNEQIFQKHVNDCTSNLKEAREEQVLALETKRALKEFISRSFDKALETISEKATKIIRCIPNTSNASIQLESTKETGDGTIKEEVNAVISADGEIGVPIKSLSGGELSSTDLAVDLAVIDYIETKTGKGLNIFILDEPFQGLGPVEIEMALEVLKNSNINKKLVIVDHNSEVKQMVQNRLVVTRNGLTSMVA